MNIFTNTHAFNADEHTPVGLYLSLRNNFRNVCLLESNDYHDRTDSQSIIGLEPLFELKLIGMNLTLICIENPDLSYKSRFESGTNVVAKIEEVLKGFHFQTLSNYNGFLGRIGFEFSHFSEENINDFGKEAQLPDLHLIVYKYMLVIDHFKDEGILLKNSLDNAILSEEEVASILIKNPSTQLDFELIGTENADFTDEEFKEIITKAKLHCQRGDVFQLVVSNQFSQAFFGDEFNIYRELRRLNPSPYLFFFDFGEYRLFGSSPEAQIKIIDGKAEIHPIAGTVVKKGDENIDKQNIAFLQSDEKENAEHTMLVDLARNDLSKSCQKVRIESYKEIQNFSHVFHIVSKVAGELIIRNQQFKVFNETFPAGTLSGTPKPKALELIAKYERTKRDFYGGAIGLFSSNGNVNTAIVIRSVLSKNNRLFYRAGAGVVLDSILESECEEVHNKLRAVRVAIENAHNATKILHI